MAVPAVVDQLLPLLDHAQCPVVNDDNLHGNLMNGANRQLLRAHLHAPVPVDRNDQPAGMPYLRPDG
ncbi:hypothetical protein D3C85_1833360 [compost metagenome]